MAYYQANWKSIRRTAQPWVESWYFLKESESSRIEHLKSLGLKARADFRKQLQAYERLKKNQCTFSSLLTQLASDPGHIKAASTDSSGSNGAAVSVVRVQKTKESEPLNPAV
jgi:hypothetical protein